MRTRTLPALTPRESWTAVLSSLGIGTADWLDREGLWLLDQLALATQRRMHLNSAVRELQARFPRLDEPLVVVDRLLSNEHSTVTLTWTREDGVCVFLGYPAQNPVLPRGQNPSLPGFDINDWMWNSRPRRPVPAGAA